MVQSCNESILDKTLGSVKLYPLKTAYTFLKVSVSILDYLYDIAFPVFKNLFQ